jgi:hypothetical protein
VSDEGFYRPDADVLAHPDACRAYTRFANGLEEAGLRDRFPTAPKLRNLMIELLAEREAVENVVADPSLIDRAITEAEEILAERGRRA